MFFFIIFCAFRVKKGEYNDVAINFFYLCSSGDNNKEKKLTSRNILAIK